MRSINALGTPFILLIYRRYLETTDLGATLPWFSNVARNRTSELAAIVAPLLGLRIARALTAQPEAWCHGKILSSQRDTDVLTAQLRHVNAGDHSLAD